MRFHGIMRKPTDRPRRSGATDKNAPRRGWEAAVRSRTRRETSSSLVEEIHLIRVLAKKLRAYLRLFRGTFPEKTVKIEDRRIQRIAKDLSRVRDEAICRQVLQWLGSKEKKESRRERLQAALARFPVPAGVDSNQRKLVREAAAIEARRLRLLALIDKHPPREGKLEERLEKQYGKSRRGMREALRKGSPEAFHQWRKQVKRLGYQVEMFCTRSQRSLASLERKFVRLGRTLGRLQDLRVLESRIETQGGFPERKLLRLLNSWMTRYRKEAELEGKSCFQMRKREFLSLLG